MKDLLPIEKIQKKIYYFRGQKVMLDKDLAELYDVETRVLNQAVKRNIKRFPKDFMFQLNSKETENWKSQIVMSNSVKMGARRNPFVFTEQGVAMLSSVLKSERAILVNIAIMRAFVQLRELIASNDKLAKKLNELEKKYDAQFRVVFDAIRKLMEPAEKPKRKIGF